MHEHKYSNVWLNTQEFNFWKQFFYLVTWFLNSLFSFFNLEIVFISWSQRSLILSRKDSIPSSDRFSLKKNEKIQKHNRLWLLTKPNAMFFSSFTTFKSLHTTHIKVLTPQKNKEWLAAGVFYFECAVDILLQYF